jgi:uncharacterized protein (DUF2062 family)
MTPGQIALSFGIGFAMAWNPFLGLHTWLILLLCLLFRSLHRPLMLLACYLNNPWTMVPMATLSALAGNLVLGRGWHLDLQGIHWHAITWKSFVTREGFTAMATMLKPILLPYLVGGLLMCVLAFLGGYYGMLALARRLRRAHLPPASLPGTDLTAAGRHPDHLT